MAVLLPLWPFYLSLSPFDLSVTPFGLLTVSLPLSPLNSRSHRLASHSHGSSSQPTNITTPVCMFRALAGGVGGLFKNPLLSEVVH
ncbi:hypothetical protein M422DRAFT_25638 [Sphaerobolus stellatus SS14]|nr:hypothetical protein M422DRAFT_25638 [Sphaerobolus stellatus SS14]